MREACRARMIENKCVEERAQQCSLFWRSKPSLPTLDKDSAAGSNKMTSHTFFPLHILLQIVQR